MNWKTPITLVVLLVFLLGAALFGWQTVISPATKDDTPKATNEPKCDKTEKFRKGELIRSSDIVVNVYNAGIRGGLAGETSTNLTNRGFKAGVSENAPDNLSAINVTILTNTKNSPQVRLVASQFKGPVRFSTGSDLAPGIDVIVGDEFQGIDHTAKKTLRLKRAVTTCASLEDAPS